MHNKVQTFCPGNKNMGEMCIRQNKVVYTLCAWSGVPLGLLAIIGAIVTLLSLDFLLNIKQHQWTQITQIDYLF